MKNKSMVVMIVMGSIVILASVIMHVQIRSVNGILEESIDTSIAVVKDVPRLAQDADTHHMISHKTSQQPKHSDEDEFWADQIEFEHTAKELNWQFTD